MERLRNLLGQTGVQALSHVPVLEKEVFQGQTMNDPVLNPPAIHGEAVAGAQAHRAQAVRKALHVLSEDIRACTFDMAVLLHEVKSGNYALGWGFESVSDYAAKELGLKERKSQYLIRIRDNPMEEDIE